MLVDRGRKISYLEVEMSFPFTNRFVRMYGFGANRLSFNGSVLIIAQSYRNVADKLIKEIVGDPKDPRIT